MTKVQGLTEVQMIKRHSRCKVILNTLKKNNKVLVFSDKKTFMVDAVCNSRSTPYITKKPEDVHPA